MSEPLIEKNPIILAFMKKQKAVPYCLASLKRDEYAKEAAYNQALIECAEIVQKASTIDAVPVVHGEWKYNPKDAIEMMFSLPKCSICGHESSDALNYCPNCGARMDGKVATDAST